MSYATELADFRGILLANLSAADFANVAWEGEPFKPPEPSGDPNAKVYWFDIEISHPGSDYSTFGGSEEREIQFDVGIMVEMEAGADKKARDLSDDLKGYFTNADTADMWYQVQRSRFGFSGVWQDSWWRVDWLLPVVRFETPGVVVTPTSSQIAITQVAHGFSAGNWLANNAGTYELAGSNEAVGVVAQSLTADQFLLQTEGVLTLAGHGFTDGNRLYLHVSTDGDAQDTEPAPGARFQQLGSVLDANNIRVAIEPQESI